MFITIYATQVIIYLKKQEAILVWEGFAIINYILSIVIRIRGIAAIRRYIAVNGAKKVMSIDLSQKMLEVARK